MTVQCTLLNELHSKQTMKDAVFGYLSQTIKTEDAFKEMAVVFRVRPYFNDTIP